VRPPRVDDGVAPDAVPFVPDDGIAPLVGDWYMPAPRSSRLLTGWRRRMALSLVGTFLVIEAVGLCSTYG
jgi:hypothetical protein